MYNLNVEVVLHPTSATSKKQTIISLVQSYFGVSSHIRPNTVITGFNRTTDPILADNVRAIIIEDMYPDYVDDYINFALVEINWFVYTLDVYGSVRQLDEVDDDQQLVTSTHLALPSAELFNLWENLYYDSNVKTNLLKYAQTMMEFSDRGIDTNIVNCNRVILLHGPPGTGKTSLCKALSQKLTIRMHRRFSSGLLIEINSHSLFSKWFSESGKLVAKLFGNIMDIVENKEIFVCVLIDEVESIAHARNQCMSGSEPSDSIRVVNAVLTQIDRIKQYKNVLILTTSNMTETIDLAFIDRADVKQYLGLPTVPAIYQIYHSCLDELIKGNIISFTGTILPASKVFMMQDSISLYHKRLIELCEKSCGLSGRLLRKIPFIAHALYSDQSSPPVDLISFLDAMDKAVENEKFEKKFFN